MNNNFCKDCGKELEDFEINYTYGSPQEILYNKTTKKAFEIYLCKGCYIRKFKKMWMNKYKGSEKKIKNERR